MRITLLIAAVASTLAFAATPSQTITYVDGNVTGLAPDTGGTLSFDDDKAVYLHTGLTTVAVPYAGIGHAELGAVKENSHDVPLYKFWARLKSHKTETQLLIVNFKTEQGDNRSMTLELAPQGARTVLADLESHTGKTFSAAKKNDTAPKTNPGWWGDQVWKTDRNADKFPKAAANDQQ